MSVQCLRPVGEWRIQQLTNNNAAYCLVCRHVTTSQSSIFR